MTETKMKTLKKRYRSGEKAFTRAEYDRLLSVINTTEEEVMVKLAVATGMRREDLANAKWSGISEDDMTLTFWEQKKRRFWTVPLPNDMMQLLRKYRHSLGRNARKQETIFPLCGRSAYRRLQALCERAGIPKRPFHALRATCIKFCQKAGWTPEQVSKLTGDTIAVIQEHYATPSSAEMQEVAREKPII